MSRFLTNLESLEKLTSDVQAAERELDNAGPGPERRMASRQLEICKLKLADVQRTYRQIEVDHGAVTIKEPQATPLRTADEIAAQGIVGIYLQGVG